VGNPDCGVRTQTIRCGGGLDRAALLNSDYSATVYIFCFPRGKALQGEIDANLGNTKEALKLLVRAARLSPRDPWGWLITSKMAWAYFVDGQFDEAVSAAKKSTEPKSTQRLRASFPGREPRPTGTIA
jgi:tetratricopeptide (TPR) repeat protein